MRLYRTLAVCFPRSYRAKLLVIVFIGTTLPVALLALWLMLNNGVPPEHVVVGTLTAVCLTLVGTLLTIVALYHLLAPVRCAADALDAYCDKHVLPRLPELGLPGDEDEMGRLLRGLNRCLRGVDAGVRELERHALHDTLTGAVNRRGCDHLMAEAVRAASATSSPLVLAMADVDNLKPLNDEHGHATGDHALVTLVSSAERWLRRDEWIGRWGGDEFLLVLHDPLPDAMLRLTDWMQGLATPDEAIMPVKISVGCAKWRPGEDATQLYRRADRAMYDAKFAGGGQLVCHDLSEPPQTPSVAVADAPAASLD